MPLVGRFLFESAERTGESTRLVSLQYESSASTGLIIWTLANLVCKSRVDAYERAE